MLYQNFSDALGDLREDYTAEALKAANINFHYLKNKRGEKTPDFLIETLKGQTIIEIGGKNKSTKQFKGLKDNIPKYVFKHGGPYSKDKLPLCLLGTLS